MFCFLKHPIQRNQGVYCPWIDGGHEETQIISEIILTWFQSEANLRFFVVSFFANSYWAYF